MASVDFSIQPQINLDSLKTIFLSTVHSIGNDEKYFPPINSNFKQ